MSVDGKTTKWNDPNIHEWTSQEDRDYFFFLIKKYRAILMGRGTYEKARPLMKLSPKRTRVVLTHNPERYKAEFVAGQLEFVNDRPEKIIDDLEKRGYNEVLLVGGESINGLFFKAGLVDEVWVTIEPFVFGMGKGLADNNELDVRMILKNVRRLNNRGSMLLKYFVI